MSAQRFRSLLERFLMTFRGDSSRRLLAAVVLSITTALLVVDFSVHRYPDYKKGDVSEIDVIAHEAFTYQDPEELLQRRAELLGQVHSFFDYDARISSQAQQRLSMAFRAARSSISDTRPAASDNQADQTAAAAAEPSPAAVVDQSEKHSATQLELERAADLHLSAPHRETMVRVLWSIELEQLTLRLLDEMFQSYIVASSAYMPKENQSFTVQRMFSDSGQNNDEIVLQDARSIKTLDEARQFLSVIATTQQATSGQEISPMVRDLALVLARETLQPNLIYNHQRSEQAKQQRLSSLQPIDRHVERGRSIVRKGDLITHQQAIMLSTLSNAGERERGVFGAFVSVMVLSVIVIVGLYLFAAGYIRKFSTRVRDLEAMAFISVLVLLAGRALYSGSVSISQLIGLGMSDAALWYGVPIAGGAMLVRILINSENALIWTVGTACFLAMMFEQQAVFAIFFIISGVVAAASLMHTKERLNILRSGLQTGLVNAALALVIELSRVYLDAGAGGETQPLWDVGIAVSGGIVSSFMALGLVPLFEAFGFVTDFKMLELANLNHPLLRQLFLRAPGTYHHSMTMAQLSEAAAEAIGANALHTKVACYYHDVGKSLQPHFFIENQRGINPHDSLRPHQSARVIITHVTDGVALGEQYDLPKPIMDAIWTHHGTSLVKYFYIKALEEAEEGAFVDEADFRYPGRLPDTKEAGIIFLADRIEAACRSIKDPGEQEFNDMIQKLVNGALTDGQLEQCPLTIQEITTVIRVFSTSLLGIYHHRIAYPSMPEAPGTVTIPVITLEVTNPTRDLTPAPDDSPMYDAEQNVETNSKQGNVT